jgi:hypothetical protein
VRGLARLLLKSKSKRYVLTSQQLVKHASS